MAYPPQDLILTNFSGLISSGQLLTSAAFRARIGLSEPELSEAVAAKRLFHVEVADQRAYPAFYLDATLESTQLEAVSRALGELSGGGKWLFFTQLNAFLAVPETAIPESPIDALRRGSFGEVLRLASAHSVERHQGMSNLAGVQQTALGSSGRGFETCLPLSSDFERAAEIAKDSSELLEFESADAQRIAAVCAAHGLLVSDVAGALAWRAYSETLRASWMSLPTDDAQLFEQVQPWVRRGGGDQDLP